MKFPETIDSQEQRLSTPQLRVLEEEGEPEKEI